MVGYYDIGLVGFVRFDEADGDNFGWESFTPYDADVLNQAVKDVYLNKI